MTPEICLWRAVVLQALWDACGDQLVKPSSGGGKRRFANDDGEAEIKKRAQYRSYGGKYRQRNAEQDKETARAWLLADTKNFPKVCYFAGWDPLMIRERARGLAELGWPVYVTERPDFAMVG